MLKRWPQALLWFALACAIAGFGGEARAEICESCREWTNDTTAQPWRWQDDAQCCLESDACQNLSMNEPNGYWAVTFTNSCWVRTTEDGYRCGSAQSFTCSPNGSPGGGPGGGSGGDECTISMGGFCPASCFNCTYTF